MRQDTKITDNVAKEFPLLARKQITFLDSASTSQKPISVITAERRFYETSNANVHRGIYKLSAEATKLYEQAHKKVAALVNCDPEEVIFTRNATESINLVMYSYGRQQLKKERKKDNIVTSMLEHHSNFVPWQQLCAHRQAELRVIDIDSDGNLDMKHAEKLIDDNTKIVAITHVSNALGTIVDIKRIIRLAHKKRAITVIDASQSVPHMKVDFKKLDADFIAFSGHKMLGPTGIGVLVGKKALLNSMQPFLYGGDMISSVTVKETTWKELPWKFEAGTPNIAGAVGLATAVEYMQKVGINKIEQHEEELAQYALKSLKSISDITIIGNPAKRAGIISFNVDKIHPHDIASILDTEDICIRAGHHCCQPLMKKLNLTATCRISFHIYNTKDDIDKLCAGIKKAQQVFK
ncbi:MAG TPA: cysteine desulfurase [Candidatus Nanoarchaeia archaeon]|nr:cysteine desulfurase [Candidatus Nanoarchaeia archaeon]